MSTPVSLGELFLNPTQTSRHESVSISDVMNDERQESIGLDMVESMSDDVINVLVRTCYEQWGKWRNYHLFRIFATFKSEPRVKFSVELMLHKMALEISIGDQLVYSRLMKSGYHNQSNLTDYIVGQVKHALMRNPLTVIAPNEYNSFLSQFRRRMSTCMDQTDMNPGEDNQLATLNSFNRETALSQSVKNKRRRGNSNTNTPSPL